MKMVVYFETDNGSSPFEKWINKLRDLKGLAAIDRRLRKIEREGLFGDHAPVKGIGAENLFELKIFVGPGYRIYYGVEGKQVVVILGGSDKGDQKTAIKKAKAHWKEYRER